MRILAIDPGDKESAYVLWDGRSILDKGKVQNGQLLNLVQHTVVDHCVIEMIACYGMPVGSEVFTTCLWIGRYMQAFGPERCSLLKRLEEKLHLCHNSRANDSNIRQALIDRFGGPQTIKNGGPLHGVTKDIWAALAVAITWFDQNVGRAA